MAIAVLVHTAKRILFIMVATIYQMEIYNIRIDYRSF